MTAVEKNMIQRLYLKMKEDCRNDTKTILEFVQWLHKEKGQAAYLLDMKLGKAERSFIEAVVNGETTAETKEDIVPEVIEETTAELKNPDKIQEMIEKYAVRIAYKGLGKQKEKVLSIGKDLKKDSPDHAFLKDNKQHIMDILERRKKEEENRREEKKLAELRETYAAEFAEAVRTGKDTRLCSQAVLCNKPELECEFETIAVYAKPDGSICRKRYPV